MWQINTVVCCHIRSEVQLLQGGLLPAVEGEYLVSLILYEFQELVTLTLSEAGRAQILEVLVVVRLEILFSSVSLNTGWNKSCQNLF